MTARLLTYGALCEVAATGEVYLSERPRLYGQVKRHGWRWGWMVTTGSRVLADGSSRTPWGAWGRAYAASQRPDILRGAR